MLFLWPQSKVNEWGFLYCKLKCPCFLNGKQCSSSNCKWLNCSNRKVQNDDVQTSCRCGEYNKSKKIESSCSDLEGRRRTKCPCYRKNKPCSEKCSCIGCQNEHGKKVTLRSCLRNKVQNAHVQSIFVKAYEK